MDAKRKSMLIDEAEQKYAELIKELEFIKESDSEFFDTKGLDKLCMFREKNVMWARENVFSPYDSTMSLYPEADGKIHSYMLYSFKYRADEHVGYVLETITEQEPLVLPSGRLSKNKTEDKKYYVVASYNFYSGNIEVNVLDASVSMTPLMRFKVYDPEKGKRFLNPEAYYEHYKASVKRNEERRREKTMTITVGMWEDMQKEIKRLENMINEHAKDVSENYERRYRSEEE
jgi:hypothetical protein